MARLLLAFDGVVVVMLVASLAISLAQCPISSDVSQDPHLSFAHGGRADFRGQNGAGCPYCRPHCHAHSPAATQEELTEVHAPCVCADHLYNFLSAPGIALNVRIEEATFRLNGGRLEVDGSFITEAHLRARVGGNKRKTATVSFWGSRLNPFNSGWDVVNGTCGVRRFIFGLAGGIRE